MKPSPVVTREVVDRARSGDRDALAEMWRTYQPQVLRFLRSCRSSSPDDVASQVWVEVGRSLRRFDGDGRDFQRWIFTIARRRDLDEGRRLARRRESPSERIQDTAASADTAADETLPLDAAIELVASLPRQMAEAIMLRVVHDLDVGAAAQIMGVSEGNVRVLVHRGLTKLRARMVEQRPTSAIDRVVRTRGTGMRVAATSTEVSSG